MTCFFIGGVCDTLGNSCFSQVSGELVSFRKLGQPDLYISYSKFIGFVHEHHTFYGTSTCRVHPWTSRELNATLSGTRTLEVELGHNNLIKNISPMQ